MQSRCLISLACVAFLFHGTGCNDKPKNSVKTAHTDAVLIVLGNEPLDEHTLTIDTVARVKKAVEFYKEHPGTLFIFTGGKTAGKASEAQMMADIARPLGVLNDSILLEEKARSTDENAKFTADIVQPLNPRRVLIVSKSDHLAWAMPRFKKLEIFKNAEPLACVVERVDSISQMRQYLEHHNSARVRDRLQKLADRVNGTD